MAQCSRCLATVTGERRSCPLCGAVLNPDGVDPPLQDPTRSTTTIANLRMENAALRAAIETAAAEREHADEESAMLRVSLAELAKEHRETMDELLALKAMLQTLDERCRNLRSRLEALGISTYRPFEANQAQLFSIPDPSGKQASGNEAER